MHNFTITELGNIVCNLYFSINYHLLVCGSMLAWSAGTTRSTRLSPLKSCSVSSRLVRPRLGSSVRLDPSLARNTLSLLSAWLALLWDRERLAARLSNTLPITHLLLTQRPAGRMPESSGGLTRK